MSTFVCILAILYVTTTTTTTIVSILRGVTESKKLGRIFSNKIYDII